MTLGEFRICSTKVTSRASDRFNNRALECKIQAKLRLPRARTKATAGPLIIIRRPSSLTLHPEAITLSTTSPIHTIKPIVVIPSIGAAEHIRLIVIVTLRDVFNRVSRIVSSMPEANSVAGSPLQLTVCVCDQLADTLKPPLIH